MKPLFENKKRIKQDVASVFDNEYEFYDLDCSSESAHIRDCLNRWFEFYPNQEKDEMIQRFKVAFSSTFFELFIHELFRCQGFELEPHPKLFDTEKRPDFLARGNGIEFYIEAKEATSLSIKNRMLNVRKSKILHKVNQIKSLNYYFEIREVKFKTTKEPSIKEIVGELENQLLKLDRENYNEILVNYELIKDKYLLYDDENLKIDIRLIPKSYFGSDIHIDDTIITYGTSFSWGGAVDAIKKSVKNKSGRYKVLDKPYLVCINSTSKFGTGEFDIQNSLFGKLNISFQINSIDGNLKQFRGNDGVLGSLTVPKNTRLSGLFITNVNPSTIRNANYCFVENPSAKRKLSFEAFKLSRIVFENQEFREVKGKSIMEIVDSSNFT